MRVWKGGKDDIVQEGRQLVDDGVLQVGVLQEVVEVDITLNDRWRPS
jgi:hypothetical protein